MIRTAAIVLAALSLAACGQSRGNCKAPTEIKAGEAATAAPPPAPRLSTDQEGFAREQARTASNDAKACVQRYAWKLAKSEEDTELVAQAAVTACDAFIAAATEAEQGAYGTRDLNAAHDANIAAMTRWATLYVVQYRTGVCD